MALPRDSFQSNIQEQLISDWREFISNMEQSLDLLEKGINEAGEMADVCTPKNSFEGIYSCESSLIRHVLCHR